MSERLTARMIIQKMERDLPALDLRLPAWARRSNPIVRRHLGIYVKTIPPQMGTILNLFALQAVIIFLTVPMPFIFNITLPLITVAIMLLPVTFYTYGQILYWVIRDSTTSMLKEFSNDTLTLLRTTPLTPQQILLGKVSAALWRRVDDLNLVLLSAVLFSAPPIVLQMAHLWSPDKYPYQSQFAIVCILGASVLRILLEPFMIASLGVMVGAAIPARVPAMTSAGLLVFFYYLLINLPRLLPLSYPMRLLVEAVLPVLLPIVLIWLFLRIGEYLLTRD